MKLWCDLTPAIVLSFSEFEFNRIFLYLVLHNKEKLKTMYAISCSAIPITWYKNLVTSSLKACSRAAHFNSATYTISQGLLDPHKSEGFHSNLHCIKTFFSSEICTEFQKSSFTWIMTMTILQTVSKITVR